LERFPFLARRDASDQAGLRQLTRDFLDRKEFHGAQGLHISDEIAVAVAAQACLPVLHLRAPYRGLDWYDDFVGIVVHAGPVRAQRETVDDVGVVHRYHEELSGEAMQDGPVMLSWQDVAGAGHSAREGYNVVIHEFVHKIDMRDGVPDGCPPLLAGFMGQRSAAAARRTWHTSMLKHHQDFCDQLRIAERFGGAQPWLDPYAGESVDEFFAVASEAYFVNPEAFARDFATLVPLFDAFFKPTATAA
jgi:MtfA peptidase